LAFGFGFDIFSSSYFNRTIFPKYRLSAVAAGHVEKSYSWAAVLEGCGWLTVR